MHASTYVNFSTRVIYANIPGDTELATAVHHIMERKNDINECKEHHCINT